MLGSNPKKTFLGVSLIELSGAYSRVDMHRVAALVSWLFGKKNKEHTVANLHNYNMCFGPRGLG